jgi:hypothetical protein
VLMQAVPIGYRFVAPRSGPGVPRSARVPQCSPRARSRPLALCTGTLGDEHRDGDARQRRDQREACQHQQGCDDSAARTLRHHVPVADGRYRHHRPPIGEADADHGRRVPPQRRPGAGDRVPLPWHSPLRPRSSQPAPAVRANAGHPSTARPDPSGEPGRRPRPSAPEAAARAIRRPPGGHRWRAERRPFGVPLAPPEVA